MSDGKNRFRTHVRAAREWLGRAESSLDRQENIRGDLNLMLAQAELQRAKETKHLTRREHWFYRVVPFMAAGAMAAGCFFFLQYERPAVVPSVTQDAVTSHVSEKSAAAEPSVQQEPDAVPAAVVSSATTASSSATTVYPPAAESVSPPATAPVAENAPAAAAPASASGVPSESMQKLMRTAGQSLRAH